MALFELPSDVRAKIWATARRRHLAARAEALLARRAAALVTTPEGSLVARLEITPTKLMHVGPTLYALGPQAVFELVDTGRVVERWWNEQGFWRTMVWGGRYLDSMTPFNGQAFGFDYKRPGEWPPGHAGAWHPVCRKPRASFVTSPDTTWWDAYNDWREGSGQRRIDPPPFLFPALSLGAGQ